MLDPSSISSSQVLEPPKPFEHSLTFFGGGGVGFGMLTRKLRNIRENIPQEHGYPSSGIQVRRFRDYDLKALMRRTPAQSAAKSNGLGS